MMSRFACRRWLGLAILTALGWQAESPTAMAKSCDKKLVVMEFLGPQNANVRTGLIRTLDAQGCDLEKAKAVDETARRLGVRLRNTEDFVKVGRKLKLDGFIEGTVSKKGRRWSLEISVRNAHDGEILKTTSFGAASHRALAKQVQRNGWQRLGGAIKVAGTATEADEDDDEEAAQPEASKAPAKSTGIRVAVLRVRGAMGSQVRSSIQESLAAEGHEVVSAAETDAVAEAFVGTPQSAEDFAKLSAELNVHAVVSARVKKKSGAYMLEANAHSGRDGMSLTSTTGVTRNKKNLGTTAQVTAQRLSPKLHYGRLPEASDEAAESPDEEAEDDDVEDDQAQEESSASSDGTYVALDASLGPWLFSRSLSYTDNIFNQVRGYSVFPAFGIAADLTWFPGAHFSDGFIAHLGLTGAFSTSFGLNSSAEGSDAEFPTAAQAYSIGLVGRIPLDELELLPTLSYGKQSFEIDHANAVTPKPANIPNVAYEYLRFGAGARFNFNDKWALLGSLGYRLVMSAGEIEDDYFPELSVGAVDLELGAAYRIVAGFEVRLTLDMQRYFMTMNPEPGDAFVAGGAIDQWFGATLSAAYRL